MSNKKAVDFVSEDSGARIYIDVDTTVSLFDTDGSHITDIEDGSIVTALSQLKQYRSLIDDAIAELESR